MKIKCLGTLIYSASAHYIMRLKCLKMACSPAFPLRPAHTMISTDLKE